MSAVYLLVLVLSHQALSYYFYNPSTHQILSLRSLRDKPYGFKLIPAPKHQNHPFRRDRTPNSYCTDSGFRCTNPYPKAQTFQFECERDSQCPTSFKCCPQACFQHKICSRAKLRPADVTNPPSTSGVCPTNTFKCSRPFPYTSTAIFECKSDRQCPESFICCQQSCFVHKICSRSSFAGVGTTPYVEELKVWGISNATEVTTPQSAPTEVPESDTEEVEATTEGASERTDATEETESSTVASTTSTFITTEATTVTDAEVSLDTTTTETTTATEEDFSTESDAPPETETTTTEELTTEMEATDGEDDENGEEVGELVSMKSVEFKSLRTTSDPNAIVPDYSEYYYDYDNRTDTDDDY